MRVIPICSSSSMDRMSPSDGDDMGSTPVSNTIFLYIKKVCLKVV